VAVRTFTDYFAVGAQHCTLQANQIGVERKVGRHVSALLGLLRQDCQNRSTKDGKLALGSCLAKGGTREIPDSRLVAMAPALEGGNNTEKTCASFPLRQPIRPLQARTVDPLLQAAFSTKRAH
jgi:hypothetical protein